MSQSSYTTQKARSDARMATERAVDDRRKNIMVLIYDHLLSFGYLDAAERLMKESGLNLANYSPADNIDLFSIVHDYEAYFETRFGKKPKLARKNTSQSQPSHTHTHLHGARGSASASGTSSDSLELGKANIPPSMARLASAAQSVSSPAPRRPVSASASSMRSRERTLHSKDEPVRARSPRDREKDKGHGHGHGAPPVYVGPGAGASSASSVAVVVEEPNLSLTTKKAPTTSRSKEKEKESPSLPQSQSQASQGDGNDLYDTPMLKPLPEAAFPGEFRDMAFSIQREIVVESPDVSWDDVKGLEDAKRILKEAVVMPIKYPMLFSGVLSPWKGLLLFGPPGTGKTLLAKAMASECHITFFNISASAIVSKWRGDSEKLVRVLFELARYQAPSCVFIDEIDSLMSARDQQAEHEGSRRLKTELLIQIDGLTRTSDQVFVLAASNLPWDLDHALLRRLEKRIYVPLPNVEARSAMLRHHLQGSNKDKDKNEGENGLVRVKTDFDFDGYAKQLVGFSGSDIRILCKEAAMQPVRRLMDRLEAGEDPDVDAATGEMTLKDLGEVTVDDWSAALRVTSPSTKTNIDDKYKKWMEKFGSV